MLNKIISILVPASHEELLKRFRKVGHTLKDDGSVLTEADLAMQERMHEELAADWPEYNFLSEEMTREQQQAVLMPSDKSFWCLDPLDGTSNYSVGIPYFASSLALIEKGQVTLGVVYDPVREECFSVIKGQGAWLNGERISLREQEHLLQASMAIVDFKRLPSELAASLASHPPYKSQRSFGSVALDWCWMAMGRAHVYLHGQQNIWDYAAGQLVFEEAGGCSSTLQGEPIFRCQLEPRSAVAALNKPLFDDWYKQLNQT